MRSNPFRFTVPFMAILVAGFIALVASPAARADDHLWNEIRAGDAVVLMRHALAPGTGDPSDFDVDDCATQRNLSAEGRQQARDIGDRFRENGIEQAQVLSSAWCRCLETAELLDLGAVETLPALNSFFRNRDREPAQTEALTAFVIEAVSGAEPVVLVTHQVNITALTGVFPRSGEMVVVRPTADGTIEVLGTL